VSQTRSSGLDRLLFEQPAVASRLAYLRIAVGASVALLVACGPFGEFFSVQRELYQSNGLLAWLPVLAAWQLTVLRVVTLVSALLLLFGYRTRAASVVCATTFFLLNGYTAAFTFPAFNYDTHLNLCLALLCFCDSGAHWSIDSWQRPAAAHESAAPNGSFALGAMQLGVALLYLQAFLAKLLFGGPAWFLNGDVVLLHTLRIGSAFGRWLCQFPEVFAAIGVVTGLFELTVSWALLRGGRVSALAALAAICFHFGTWLVLDISFWHLVVLLPPLFVVGARKLEPTTETQAPRSISRALGPPPPSQFGSV
jgi:hypothetical protein